MSSLPADDQRALDATDPGSASRIPIPVASFVGREKELARIPRLLDDDQTRLLTLTGPGGVGKTRLALEVARRVEADFADGSRYVRLATARDPSEALPTVAHAVGATVHRDRSLMDTVVDALRDRHVLLALDNFEHLLAVPPRWLETILARCPRITVLVTSRRPISIAGERVFTVSPMPVPDHEDLDVATRTASIALFAQRASAIRSDFAVSAANIHDVIEICRRVDGLPLAIELAAARIRVMPPREILHRLDDRLTLLASRYRDVPQRHHSMHATIAWSHDLLADNEQRAFRELAVFSGGFRLPAAQRVLDLDDTTARETVNALVGASLLRASAIPGGETRYVMLETIRAFGLEQLDASGESSALRDRHADWCIALARSAEPVDPVVDTTWFDRLEEERANMVAALNWLSTSGRLDDFAQLLIGTRWLWYPAGRESEGLAWFDRLLESHPSLAGATRSEALCWRGHLAQMLNRPDATIYLDEALRLAREFGTSQQQAVVVETLAIMAEDSGDYQRGESLFQSARELYAQAGADWAFLTIDYHLGVVKYGMGDLDGAQDQLDSTRRAAEAASEQLVPVWTRNFLALVACAQGDPDRAIATLVDQPIDLASGHWHDMPVYIGTVAVIASTRRQHAVAARLFGLMSRHDGLLMLPERAAFERAMETSRASLGDADWSAEMERGRRMRRTQAEGDIRRALRLVSAVDTVPNSPSPVNDLTRRERDVLRLLADGLTNREIANALSVSHRTVSTHINNILAKLDVRSRTAAAAFAIRNAID